MFSSDENAVKEWTNYIIYGVIGIIVIMSAKFIGQNIYDIITVDWWIEWYKIATSLYDKILYPFIKLAIYLVLGAMFVILLWRVITFLFGSDTDAQKKAGTLIWRNIISMLIIIWSKQIVEVIYWARDKVVNENMTNLWEIGSWVLENKSIPILYDIINYALGIASLVILVIIIVQTLKLLMKPDDPAQAKSIKTSLMYMFIGILILWAGYLIVNFAIIN
jgi:multisubunit Na+/H+ antiporter MnhB subunit